LENLRLENFVVALLKCPLPYLDKNVPFFESCDGTAVVGLVGTVESALCVKGPTGNYAAVVLPGETAVNNDLISGHSVSERTRLKKKRLSLTRLASSA